MSFNGAGTFVINSAGNPVVTGTTISSTWANALTADLATGLSTTVCKDGQTTTTAAVPFALGLTTPTGYGFAAGGSNSILGYFLMRASANQDITTNTTLASATNMGFAIAASEEWVAAWDITLNDIASAGLSTTGMKWALDVPAGATMMLSVALTPTGINLAGAGGTNTLARFTTTDAAALDFTAASMPDFTAGGLLRISAWVLNSSTAGNVQLQVAQSTSSATALRISKGSNGVAWRKA